MRVETELRFFRLSSVVFRAVHATTATLHKNRLAPRFEIYSVCVRDSLGKVLKIYDESRNY